MKTGKKEVKNFGELTEFLSEKFDKIDERFDEVNEKIDTLDKKVDTLDKKTSRIEENLDSLAIIANDGFIEAQKDRNRIESNLTSVIRMDKERNSEFHIKVIEILEKNKLVNKKDVDYLMILAK